MTKLMNNFNSWWKRLFYRKIRDLIRQTQARRDMIPKDRQKSFNVQVLCLKICNQDNLQVIDRHMQQVKTIILLSKYWASPLMPIKRCHSGLYRRMIKRLEWKSIIQIHFSYHQVLSENNRLKNRYLWINVSKKDEKNDIEIR